jgi:hypothetical protein
MYANYVHSLSRMISAKAARPSTALRPPLQCAVEEIFHRLVTSLNYNTMVEIWDDPSLNIVTNNRERSYLILEGKFTWRLGSKDIFHASTRRWLWIHAWCVFLVTKDAEETTANVFGLLPVF